MYICIYVYRLHLSLRPILKVFPVLHSLILSFSLTHTHSLSLSISFSLFHSHSLFLARAFSLSLGICVGLCTYTRTINIYDVTVVENIHDWLLLQLYSLFRVQLFCYTNDFSPRDACDVMPSPSPRVCVCVFPTSSCTMCVKCLVDYCFIVNVVIINIRRIYSTVYTPYIHTDARDSRKSFLAILLISIWVTLIGRFSLPTLSTLVHFLLLFSRQKFAYKAKKIGIWDIRYIFSVIAIWILKC